MNRRIPTHLASTLVVAVLALTVSKPNAQPTTQPSASSTPVVAPTPIDPGAHSLVLGEAGGCDDEGRLFDEFVVDVVGGSWLRVWSTSDDFDTVLTLTGPGDWYRENDDFVGGSLNSAIELRPEEAGQYTIRVRSYGAGSSGSYELGVAEIDPASETVMPANGTLDDRLAPAELGDLVQSWGSVWVTARGGERMRLRVTSPDFDTVAMLIAPGGQVWFNDDANDTGPDGTESTLDSTVEAVAPVTGTYHLIVTPYGGTGAGSFRVRGETQPPVTLAPGEERPSMGHAGVNGRGHIYGVFAGITDYPGDDSDLYGCADDATLLAQAFRDRGLMAAADQIVLTDAQVTPAGFLDAISRLEPMVGPHDVVIIFYSGHGDTVPAAPGDRSELDGTDERLAVYGGAVTDNDVVARIDELKADTIVLAIDACHSGGFERDFVTEPGRVGMFSSAPDVLSDTAEGLRAGGYLSWYLREAVLGHADRAPADGAMLAGELTDYMVEGFVLSYRDMNPRGDDSPDQALQVDRGSMQHGDLLWLYPRRPDGSLEPVPAVSLQSAPPANDMRVAGGTCR